MELTGWQEPGSGAPRRTAPRRTAPPAGRETELADLRRFLESLRDGPSVLLMRGPAGMGKSALLVATVAMTAALGAVVLQASPDAPEASLPFSALFDLVDPVLDAAATALPRPQLDALRVAVQRDAPGPAPVELLAVAAGMLSLIRWLTVAGPVLVVVDDLHWLDDATASVLRFVLRRLRDEPVGFLATMRGTAGDGAPAVTWLDRLRLPVTTVEIGPLSDDAVLATLRAGAGPALSARQARQVVEAAGGNPLFALELRRAVQRGSPRPGEPLLEPPDSLRSALEARMAAFDPDVREALAVAATLAQPRLTDLGRALGTTAAARLAPALADGVLEEAGDRVRFAHPLLRSVAYRWGDHAARVARHRRLARIVDDPVERARHLAAGVRGPDARAARLIADGAETARRRGAPDDAADLFLAAASLVHRDRGTSMAWTRAAADCRVVAARPDEARELLEALIGRCPPGVERAGHQLALAAVLYRQEDAASAVRMLQEARDEAAGDATMLVAVEQELALVTTMAGNLAEADRHARRALELAESTGDERLQSVPLAFVTIMDFLGGRGYDEDRLLRAIELEPAAPPVLHVEWRPSMIRALTLAWLGRLEESSALLERLHAEAQAAGDEAASQYVLYVRCLVELAVGRWDLARALAEAARIQSDDVSGAMGALLRSAVARVDACTGRLDEAAGMATAALELAMSRGYGPAIQESAAALGFAALSQDRPDRAAEALAPLLPFLASAGIRDPGVLTFMPDLVEALLALGRVEEACAALQPYQELAERLRRASALPLAARCRALLELARDDLDAALAWACRALELHEGWPMPFERARTQLVLGTIHRRRREKRSAAAALDAALRVFDELGSPQWAAMARRERARVGFRPADPDTLSQTEHRVAELAARGLTGREIAAAAFLSPKGVEKALARVYRKLGVRSRVELVARIAEVPVPAGGLPAARL
jgi:DNA-binding CsgD family transcriptional regulator